MLYNIDFEPLSFVYPVTTGVCNDALRPAGSPRAPDGAPWLPACLHACMPACLPARLPACKPACLQSCMHTCPHGRMPTLCACMPACLHGCTHGCVVVSMRQCTASSFDHRPSDVRPRFSASFASSDCHTHDYHTPQPRKSAFPHPIFHDPRSGAAFWPAPQ
jgi:hypothetical protein